MKKQTIITKHFIIGLIFLVATLASPAAAQEEIQVTDQAWDSAFRDHLTFTLSAQSPTEITEASLFYRVVGQLATSRNEAEFTPGTAIEAQFTIDQTKPANYFPPGTELEYWWKLVDANGTELKTEGQTLLYLDERFEWQTLENERLTLYWYQGDDQFGQALFERANLALDTLATDIGIELESPIKIFIYANHQDLLSALSVTAQEWTGGVAFTQYGVVILGINPVQLDWGLNAMTHEMSHLVIHQATDNPFSGLPRWLDEGIAVYNENRDELDDDFRPVFERAVANNDLMTLRTLSSHFPADPVKANLAYGQSGAVVKFIVDTYGSDAMAELLSIFAEGAIPDEALQQALGVDTDGLDNAFRASLELPPLPGSEAVNVEPETAAESEESAVSQQAEPEESRPEETEAEAVAEAAATPQPDPPNQAEGDASAQPANGGILAAIPCLGGLILLLLAGWGVYRTTL